MHKHLAYTIGVNFHSMLLHPWMVVSLDEDHCEILTEEMKGCYDMLVSNNKHADVQLGDCPAKLFSGHAAVWLADMIGFKNIVLCGFDCYQSNRGHWHSYPNYPPRQNNPTEERAKSEWEGIKQILIDPSAISVTSGVLQEVFQPWG
jgi:hypothetical protein